MNQELTLEINWEFLDDANHYGRCKYPIKVKDKGFHDEICFIGNIFNNRVMSIPSPEQIRKFQSEFMKRTWDHAF